MVSNYTISSYLGKWSQLLAAPSGVSPVHIIQNVLVGTAQLSLYFEKAPSTQAVFRCLGQT